MTIKNLWTEYDGKGFSAEHANYAERATADEAGNDIQATYATKTENDGKADKVASATSGNFAGLDANGNLIDSGSKASDFLQEDRIEYIEGTIASGPSGFVVTCSATYNEIAALLRSGKVPVCKFTMPSSQFNQAWYFYYHITTTSKHSFGSMDVAPSYGENASYASCVYVETNNSWHFLEVANYSREYWNRLLGQKQNIISDLETIRSGAAAGATAVQPDDLATVATSGSYNDLSDKPSIPADNVLILQDNGFNRALVKAAWDAHKVVQAWSGTPAFRTRLTKVETPDADTEVYHFTAIVPVNRNKSVLNPTWRVFDSQYIYTISTGTYAHGGDSKDIVSPVQPDWLQSDETALDYIKGKPNLALKENVANKTETVRQSSGADNTHYPSEAAVRSAIDSAVSSAYKAAGTKRAAELTSSLLVAANEGNVYNITEAGTTDNNFVDGAGKTINVGDNVGVCKVGNDYKFDLLSGFVDLSDYLTKTGNASNTTSTFTKNASDNSGMTSGGKLSALFTAISNFFASLKALAFKDEASYSDLSSSVQSSLDKADSALQAAVEYVTTSSTWQTLETAYNANKTLILKVENGTNWFDEYRITAVNKSSGSDRFIFCGFPTMVNLDSGNVESLEVTEWICYLDGSTTRWINSTTVNGLELTTKGYVAQAVSGKADKATNLTGATKTKITYNSQGIVTSGADLAAGDIPALPASKITSGTFAPERIGSTAGTSGQYLKSNGSGNAPSWDNIVFVANYSGSSSSSSNTPFADIKAAYNAGKVVLLKQTVLGGDVVYQLVTIDSSKALFTKTSGAFTSNNEYINTASNGVVVTSANVYSSGSQNLVYSAGTDISISASNVISCTMERNCLSLMLAPTNFATDREFNEISFGKWRIKCYTKAMTAFGQRGFVLKVAHADYSGGTAIGGSIRKIGFKPWNEGTIDDYYTGVQQFSFNGSYNSQGSLGEGFPIYYPDPSGSSHPENLSSSILKVDLGIYGPGFLEIEMLPFYVNSQSSLTGNAPRITLNMKGSW